jgi:hypothetical protein
MNYKYKKMDVDAHVNTAGQRQTDRVRERERERRQIESFASIAFTTAAEETSCDPFTSALPVKRA